MQTIWLMYSDEAMTQPDGWSWWQQPLETWPYQAEMTTADTRYAAYYATCFSWTQASMPTPTPAAQ